MRTALVSLILWCGVNFAFGQSAGIEYLEPKSDEVLNDSSRISLLLDIATKFEGTGSTREAASLLKEAYHLADSLTNPYLLQKASAAYSGNLLDRDRPDSALIILERSLKRFPNSEYNSHLLNLAGTAYRFKSDYEAALDHYQNALALVDSAENPTMYGGIKQNMGVIYENTGNKAAALNSYLSSLNLAEAAQDSTFLATVLNNIGDLYNQFSEPAKAVYYLEKSREVSENINFRAGLLRSTSNLANSKKKLLDYKEALSLYNEALKLHEEVRFNTPPFRLIYNMGELHLSTGNLEQAETNFNQSLRYSQELDLPQGIYYNKHGLANVAEQRGELKKAIDYHQQALVVAESIGFAGQQNLTIEKIYTLYKELGEYHQALGYLEQFKVISDSLYELEIEERLSETEALMDLRKQEQDNVWLQERQQVQEARITTQNWLILAGLTIIALILASVVLLHRSKLEKQRINEELELQRNQLQQMNKVKDKILAIIAHDLRSPLSSMHGMLYLLRENELSQEEVKTMAVQMELSLSQNINMMDNLLVWAREQMTGLAVNLQTVTAREVVQEIFATYEFKARQKGVDLINKVSLDLKVQADYNLLKLILRNLVANSIKFTRKGDAITVSTREADGKIAFEVNDTGIGIPEEDQRDLFSMYGQSRQGTANEKGSGLGLQLCKEFVEKQDGEIAVQSTVGKGTTFRFTLPKAS